MRSVLPTLSLLLALGFSLPSALPFARADDDEAPALATAGSLAKLDDEFFELSYRKLVPGKRKPKAHKAYLKVTESTAWFADMPGKVGALEEGASVWIYGAPVESESVDQSGNTVIERQIRGTLAIATGEALTLKQVKAEKNQPHWVMATVTSKKGAALEVSYSGQSYRVLTSRNCPVVIRTKLEKRPEKLKKKIQGAVLADTSSDRPEKAKAKITDSFAARVVVIFNKRLNAAYGLMLRP